jgi:heavy metal sensor kinase
VLGALRQTRVRLTAAVTLVFVGVAAAAAVAVWLTLSHFEYAGIDSSLTAQAQTVLAGLQDSNGRISLQGGDPLPGQTSGGIAVGAILFDSAGKVLDTSGSAPAAASVRPMAVAAAGSGTTTTATVATGGQEERGLASPVDLGGGARGALVVTRPVGEVQRTLFVVGGLLGGVVVLLAAVTSVLAYVLAGRALRPVRVIASTAREISEQDLHRRITLDLPDDELGELAATFNGMLGRLDASFTSLQQFTTDAAHELRAPLALLRAELEVSLSRVRTPDEYQGSQRIALAEVNRLSRLADQLLLLSRAETGELHPAFRPVDVGDLVEETVERWRPLAAGRDVHLRVEVRDEGTLPADPDLLRRVVDNLVDNAVRHSPVHGIVSVAVRHDAHGWDVTVSDQGPGVPAELRPTLFERFTRGDVARGRDTGGAGLGLSLSRAIAEAHGGWIRLEDGEASGARFRLHLPDVHLPDGQA